MVVLASLVAIADNKTDTYVSEVYLRTKKNMDLIQKEVNRLNSIEAGRYRLHYPLAIKSNATKVFNPKSY